LWTDLDNKFEIREDLSKQMGRHAFKVGANYMKLPVFGGIFRIGQPRLHRVLR